MQTFQESQMLVNPYLTLKGKDEINLDFKPISKSHINKIVHDKN